MQRLILACVVLSLACATGGSSPTGAFSQNVGLATAVETAEMSRRILGLHQFEILEEQPAPNIYIETRWRERTPFADEQALGVVAAEVRAIVRARPRSGTSQMGQVYNVELRVEQRVRVPDSPEWVTGTMTRSARQFAADIAEDLRTALEIGVRRFGSED